MSVNCHYETIKCPECKVEQDAKVEHKFPWDVYIHECEECGHIIMESEWENVEREDLKC